MKAKNIFYVVDTHTEGEPTRIVISGIPKLKGANVSEKRMFMRSRLDWLRTALLMEPRGHQDQFGAIVLPSHEEYADYALIFMDTGGYLDMCCHAVIGVTTALIETGIVEAREPYTYIRYETVAGIVTAKAKVSGCSVEEVSVIEVPSFYLGSYELKILDRIIPVHVAYGGNFFVIAESEDLEIKLRLRNINELIKKGLMLRDEASRLISVHHPTQNTVDEEIKLAMITGDPELPESNGKNIVIFGNGQFDRSPCGTGTAARLATMYKLGLIKIGQLFIHESIINTTFKARIIDTTRIGQYDAVIPEITGKAFITQICNVVIDSRDPLWTGFNIRG